MTRNWGPEAFVGGHVALDFTNTVGGHKRERIERLDTYGDWVAWAQAAAVLDDAEADSVSTLAERDPRGAAKALDQVREQRESLYRCLAAAVAGDGADATDRANVADQVADALRGAQLGPDPIRGSAWITTVDVAGLALPSRRLALATAALLTGEDRRRIGLCGRCSWLFLDPSPTRRRRWCSMATCGNRAKAERHHARAS